VAEAHCACLAPLEADVGEAACGELLPKPGGIPRAVEGPDEPAAVPRAGTLRRELHEYCSLRQRVEVSFLRVEEHHLELVAGGLALGGGLADDEAHSLQRRSSSEELIALVACDILRHPPAADVRLGLVAFIAVHPPSAQRLLAGLLEALGDGNLFPDVPVLHDGDLLLSCHCHEARWQEVAGVLVVHRTLRG